MIKAKNSLSISACPMAEIYKYAKRYTVDIYIYFAKSEQRFPWISTDAEAVAVRSVDALATSEEETDTGNIIHYMHIIES